jgi:hypothetical protein
LSASADQDFTPALSQITMEFFSSESLACHTENANMVMRVTPLSTQEELAPKYQNHQSAKDPFPCPSYTNQDICTQLPRES